VSALGRAALFAEAWLELARVDIARRARGFRGIADLPALPTSAGKCDAALMKGILDALALASCAYWKPVLCLQRSVALVRVMRRHRVHARLVIAYRPSPFVAHAWVEVDGRIINDSQEYANRLQVILTA
jgi:hypothetical protein